MAGLRAASPALKPAAVTAHAPASRAHAPSRKVLLRPLAAANNQGFGGPLDDVEAYGEAHELYMQANKISQLQTRYEMETAWATEAPPQGTGALPPAESAVMALLQEHGLSTREAASLFKDLYSNKPGSSAPPQPPPAPQPSRPAQRPPAPTSGNPLDVIPLAPTGVPGRGRAPQPSNPFRDPGTGTAPGAPRRPAVNQVEDEWEWGVASAPDYSSGSNSGSISGSNSGSNSGGQSNTNGQGRSSQNSGYAAPAAAGGQDEGYAWEKSSKQRPPASSGGRPSSSGAGFAAGAGIVAGASLADSLFSGMCGETVTPIPYDRSQDSYSNGGGYAGGAQGRPGGRSGASAMPPRGASASAPGRSLGGCGDIPNWDEFDGPAASPTPYPNTSRPSGGVSPTQGRSAPASAPGRSLGGCGDIPNWDEFDGTAAARAPSAYPNTSRPSNGPSSTQGRSAPASAPGRSLGGCGDIPNWDEFDGTAAARAPSAYPNNSRPSGGVSSAQGRSAPASAPGRSLGGCGDIPNWDEFDGSAAAAAPSAYQNNSRPAGGVSSSQGRSAPASAPGRSLGGCGDIPNWDEFDGTAAAAAPAAYQNNSRPSSTQGRSAPASAPGRSLGGCGDIPNWDEFDGTAAAAAPPARSQYPNARAGPASPAAQPQQRPNVTPSQRPGAASSNGASMSPALALPAPSYNAPPTADTSPLTLSQLSARLDQWQRVLPGINPARLAAVDADFLKADVAMGLRALITLVGEFPNRDVMGMLDRVPRLLWAEELKARVRRCVTTLMRLHPSRDEDIVKDMMVEYPELVFRMDYYTKARLIDELPIEIQNMMVVADQGIGYTYRYYKNRKTDYQAEITSDEPFEQQT